MFEFVTSGVHFDWSFDDIKDQMKPDVYYGENLPQSIYDDIDGAYFQTFYSKVSLTINFSKYFPELSNQVLSKVLSIQDQVRREVETGHRKLTPLVEILINKNIIHRDILFLRMEINQGSDPHVDRRRAKALNIGFKNSSTCCTYFKPGKDYENFYDDYTKLSGLMMNDGDAWLVDVGQAHSVKTNFPDAKPGEYRYIITVNLGTD
jgi:hypothetical protein